MPQQNGNASHNYKGAVKQVRDRIVELGSISYCCLSLHLPVPCTHRCSSIAQHRLLMSYVQPGGQVVTVSGFARMSFMPQEPQQQPQPPQMGVNGRAGGPQLPQMSGSLSPFGGPGPVTSGAPGSSRGPPGAAGAVPSVSIAAAHSLPWCFVLSAGLCCSLDHTYQRVSVAALMLQQRHCVDWCAQCRKPCCLRPRRCSSSSRRTPHSSASWPCSASSQVHILLHSLR